MRRIALTLPLAVVIALACGVTAPTALAPSSPTALPSAAAAALPKPIPQPITRTSGGAQVAWLLTVDQSQVRSLIGVGPKADVVATIDVTKLGTSGITRTADGASLVLFTEDRIDIYSAFNGKPLKTYRAAGARVVASAFASDGRWVALLLPGGVLQLLDLQSGLSQMLTFGHDPKAQLPGLSGNIADAIWATLSFAPDSRHLYVLGDWGGPARVSAFALAGDTWAAIGSALGTSGGSSLSCGGPAMAAKVVDGGRMFAAFCHVSGAVWLFDVGTLGAVTVLQPSQKNPFWLSPIFTPDGQLLYLHQWPAFGDEVQVVDFATRRVLGPAPTPTKLGVRGPFAWLAGVAYAGGTASTQPVSPDGLKIYSAFSGGIAVLRVPDLAPVATLASGTPTDEVWISGSGKTVFATTGSKLIVASEDGSGQFTVDLGHPWAMFISSERG